MLTEDQQSIIKSQDETLDRIGNVVKNIKVNSNTINGELNTQIIKLNDTEFEIDKTSSRLERVNKKVRLIIKNSNKCDKFTYAILIFVIFLLLCILIYVIST
jgi:uncharacterized protein Yka (UPF0111/DUF47 family)